VYIIIIVSVLFVIYAGTIIGAALVTIILCLVLLFFLHKKWRKMNNSDKPIEYATIK